MTLEELRRRIDAVDAQLVRLLGERAELVLLIGRLKHDAGVALHQPDRERAVLAHVRAANRGPLSDEALGRLFRAVMDEFMRLQRERKPEHPSDE